MNTAKRDSRGGKSQEKNVVTNNPFGGTNRIRFVGYDLSPSGRAPLCLCIGKGKNKKWKKEKETVLILDARTDTAFYKESRLKTKGYSGQTIGVFWPEYPFVFSEVSVLLFFQQVADFREQLFFG